jgi:hypothetical protein
VNSVFANCLPHFLFSPLLSILIENQAMKKPFFTFLMGMTLLYSCSEKETDPQPTRTELLTNGSWKYDSGGVDSDRNGTIDITIESTGFPACRLDNIGTFQNGGLGINDEGPTKCNAGDPQTTNFNWSLTDSDSKLNISGSGFFGASGQFNVRTLTNAQLSISKDTMVGSFNALLIVNMKK